MLALGCIQEHVQLDPAARVMPQPAECLGYRDDADTSTSALPEMTRSALAAMVAVMTCSSVFSRGTTRDLSNAGT